MMCDHEDAYSWPNQGLHHVITKQHLGFIKRACVKICKHLSIPSPAMSITLNDKEVESLQKLRQSVTDILEAKHDDAFLLRWLRARNMDPEKAEEMLRKSQEWRKQKNMDTILKDYVQTEFMKRYYPIGHFGYDKEGCPILFCPFGYYDIRGLLQSLKREDMVKRIEVTMERSLFKMEEQTKKLGRPITQHVVIADMEHFGISHFMSKPALNFLKQIFHTYDNNYPEILKSAFWINAPKTVQFCYTILKPFIHENTQKKIQIFGKDEWKEALFKIVDPSQIPERWGGTFKESPNGNWWDVLDLSGQIPESSYNEPGKRLSNEKDVINVTVSNNDNLCIDIPVQKSGTGLKWAFQTEDSDIGFGISLSTCTGIEEIIPVERVDTHLFAEEGSILCDKIGTYQICFDNKFSYIRSKKLSYKLEILTPEQYQNSISEDD